MELQEGKKYFFVSLNKPCIIVNINTQAGGVSGDKNVNVTIEFTDGIGEAGDCRTFPIGLAERYLREVRRPMQVGNANVEETLDEDGETVIL